MIIIFIYKKVHLLLGQRITDRTVSRGILNTDSDAHCVIVMIIIYGII